MSATDAITPSDGHGTGAAIAGFVCGAALGLLPLALPASPWALLATVPALALHLCGAAFALRHRPEQGWWPTLLRRLPAVFGLLLLAAATLLLLAGWPAWALLQNGALLPVLGLSAALALCGFGFARWWPAIMLPLIDAPRPRRPFALIRRSLREAQALVASDPSPSRAVLAATAWLLLLAGALVLGLAAGEMSWTLRLSLSLGWALLLAPFLAFVLVALVEPARLASAQTVIPPLPKAPPRDGAATPAAPVGSDPAPTAAAVPLAVPGPSHDPTARLYAAARAGRVDEALAALEAGADPHALPGADDRDQRALPVLAAVLDDARLLRALIARGVDLNRAHAGLTPLRAATRDSLQGRPDAVMTLLANGADPRDADAEGRTALHFAALAGEPEIAAMLLDAGADIDAVNRDGYSPLGVACGAGNWRLARFLLERRARPEPEGGQPALLAAAAGDDDPAGVHLLLRHKARVDARGRLGRTALQNACLAGNADIVDVLLGAGAGVDVVDEHRVSPLHEAARAGANAVLERLAAARPDVTLRDAHGRTALAVACQSASANRDSVRRLLALGADPAAAADDGRTPLQFALAAGRWPLVAELDPAYPLPSTLTDAVADIDLDAPWPEALQAAIGTQDPARIIPVLRGMPPGAVDALVDRLLDPATPPTVLPLLAAALTRAADPAVLDALPARLAGAAAQAPLAALIDAGIATAGRGLLAAWLTACCDHGRDGIDAERLALALLERGADPFSGSTVALAVRLDWPQLVAALLARGVDADGADRNGRSALHLAVERRATDLVRLLLRHGARPDRRDVAGSSPLGLAIAHGDPELSDWLDWPQWRLPPRPLLARDLIDAAASGDAGAVRRLHALGLPLDSRDGRGATALMRAAGGGHADVVAWLLAAGADPALPAQSGATCLSAAISARHAGVVQLLLEAGVPVDQTLPGGITPLMIAAALGWPDIVDLLLDAGADVARVDEAGNGVLHALAQFGFGARERGRATALWQRLLAAGAAPDARNADGLSPLLLLLGARAEAGSRCDEDVLAAQLEILLTRQLDLDARDHRGFGPLHLAALHGQLRAARRLLVAGADHDARDALNRRAHDIAVMRGFVDIAAELEGRSTPAPSLARFLRDGRD